MEEERVIPKFDFNWNDFHQMLDRALAAYLEDGGSIHDEIIQFGSYSNDRRMPEDQTDKSKD